MKSREPTPCQSVPNCWTFSAKDCCGTEVTFLGRSADLVLPWTVSVGLVVEEAGVVEEPFAGTSLQSAREAQALTPMSRFGKPDHSPLHCHP
jgi:hypothetical protein